MSDQELSELNHLLSKELSSALVEDKQQTDETTRTRMLANVMRRVRTDAPQGTVTIRDRDVPWEYFVEGVERKRLVADHGDGTQTCIYRMQPGAKLTGHSHRLQETCWVISGEILVGDHPVQAGEMHIAEAGFRHPEIVARSEAHLLIRSQVFKGSSTHA
ncbi:MAG: cupin domain-containing protein [Pseudomonadota bacterium]